MKTTGRFVVEVVADGSGKWCSNALRFDTVEDAKAYALDLSGRWTAVRKWRVMDAFASPNSLGGGFCVGSL